MTTTSPGIVCASDAGIAQIAEHATSTRCPMDSVRRRRAMRDRSSLADGTQSPDGSLAIDASNAGGSRLAYEIHAAAASCD
jgi:hypothetical protein